MRTTRALLIALVSAAVLSSASQAEAASEKVTAGSLRLTVEADPWRVELTDTADGEVLRESLGRGTGPSGSLGFRTSLGWFHALRASSLSRDGAAVVAVVETTDPLRRTLNVRIAPAGEGSVRLSATVEGATTSDVEVTGMGFEAEPGERYLGTGERSHAVDLRGLEVENYVADGPNREEDRQYPKAATPPWASRDRDDATYYPVPWMLSSRGYGVLVDNDETSFFRLGSDDPDAWSLEAESPRLELAFFAGPKPADALRRFTAATGRQPPPPTPYTFGPWFQTGQPNITPLAEEGAIAKKLRDADAPVSVAETQMHFLPCGAHRGNEEYNKARTEQFHSLGLAHLIYFNPILCASYQPVYAQATAAGVLQRAPGGAAPYQYTGFVGGSGPAGFTIEPLSQFDFTAPATEGFYERLIREATDTGHDGWMEDFGEYTPPNVESADGTPGPAMHNRYPTDYHCTVFRITQRLERPVVRFMRSGWTGTARCAVNVWGGDPTTVFGYDGLESAVKQALSIGLSGVSRWGTDIGGYNTFGPMENLTPELLKRWIEFGAVTGVMRTKRSGLAFPPYQRPQVFDDENLPVWRRYTKLHTQLYPYILAADANYRATGMPLMSHLALSYPDDSRAGAQETEFMYGPDLLTAPVVTDGARERKLYVPDGRWIDLWRSARFDERTGGLVLGRPRVLGGGRDHTVPAPLDELPLLARAGTLLPMLPADVDTLAEYGRAPGLVHLSDRRDRMELLAFPRGRSSAGFNEGERLRSVEGRKRWTLTVDGKRRRRYHLQSSIGTLERPFTPQRVTANGKTLPRTAWSSDSATRTLTVSFSGRRVVLRVEGRAAQAPPAGAPRVPPQGRSRPRGGPRFTG